MPTMPKQLSPPLFMLLGAVILGVLLLRILIASMKRKKAAASPDDDQDRKRPFPYKRVDAFFTPAERSFYEVLKRELSADCILFAKVRLCDILSLRDGTQNARSWQNSIQQKHVDFVVCTLPILRPVLVIELDDSSHRKSNRIERDRFLNFALADADLQILRVEVTKNYDPVKLREQIRSQLSQTSEDIR